MKKSIRVALAIGTAAAVVSVAAACSSSSQPTSSASASPTASSSATRAADSEETHIVWANKLDTPLTFSISDVDNYDFDGVSRPDHNYPEGINGYTLQPGSTHDERIEVNTATEPHFNFTARGPQGGGESLRLAYYGVTGDRITWGWDDGKWNSTKTFTYVDANGQTQTARAELFSNTNATSYITFTRG